MKKTNSTVLLLLILSAVSMTAQAKFLPNGSCGQAKFEGGTSCEDFKVKLSFEGCKISMDPQVARIKKCGDNEFTARFQEKDFRLEAQFKKKSDGWNGNSWELVGTPVALERDYPVQPAVAKVEAKAVPAEAPALKVAEVKVEPKASEIIPPPVARNPSQAAAIASALKFSGYLDFRYTSFSAPSDPGIADVSPYNGFALEEGATTKKKNYKWSSTSLFVMATKWIRSLRMEQQRRRTRII